MIFDYYFFVKSQDICSCNMMDYLCRGQTINLIFKNMLQSVDFWMRARQTMQCLFGVAPFEKICFLQFHTEISVHHPDCDFYYDFP